MKTRQSASIDMTRGSIMKNVLLFALPICLGNVLQQLYSTVDTIIIGRFCTAASLAAVGTSSQPVELLLCIFMGIGSGVSILVAQFKGSGDVQKLSAVTRTATAFVYLVSIPLMILGQFLGPLILKLMQVPEDTWNMATAYIRVIFFATLGNIGYNLNSGILRGLGDSQASLKFLVVSAFVNISLDWLFVGILGLDVPGAAIATAVSMVVSWLCSVFYIKKHYPKLNFTLFPRRPDLSMLRKIIRVGFPLGLNHSLYSVGHIALQSLINLQGTAFIAGCSVAGKVNGLANMVITGLSSAAQTFSGQNYGAGDADRLREGSWKIPLANASITAAAGFFTTFVVCDIVIGFFTKDAAVLAVARKYVHLVLPFSWCYSVLNTIISYANGAGEIKYPTVINLLMLWAVRIPSAFVIHLFFDGSLVMLSLPISFGFGMTCMILFLFSRRWKNRLKALPVRSALRD